MFEHQSRALLKFDGDFLLGEHNFYFLYFFKVLKLKKIQDNKLLSTILIYYSNYYTRITCTVHSTHIHIIL